jgi:hypothetical protein
MNSPKLVPVRRNLKGDKVNSKYWPLAIMIMLIYSCSEDSAFFGNIIKKDAASSGAGAGDLPHTPDLCGPGAALSIWTDMNSNGEIDGEDQLKGYIKAYIGDDSAKENYNYYSASAHPKIGPGPKGFESKVFFYENEKGNYLNFYFNIDAGGSEDNKVQWEIKVIKNEMKDKVILSDDGGELKLKDKNQQEGSHFYEGDFHYWNNTDGGVIGPFIGDEYEIHVKPLDSGDNEINTFYSQKGELFSLPIRQGDGAFIIKKYDPNC